MNQTCSNCGKKNFYEKKEYQSRETTKCKFCGHTLSVCSGFVELLKK